MGPPPCLVHAIAQPGLCQICAKRAAYTKARLRTLAVVLGALAVTAGVAIFLSTRPARVPPPPKPEGDLLEPHKRERLAQKPCDAEATLDLVEYLMSEQREVAERAGIVPSAPGQTATLWQEVRINGQPARVGKLSLGGATATNVELAISDDLAVGDDGVIGLSFLWHFDVTREENAVTLSPPR